MTLGNLLDRVYARLGDNKAFPKFFDRQVLVDRMNQGCIQFRAAVEDKWFREDIPVVSGTAIYNFPEKHVRCQRLAFEDVTVEPRDQLGLVADDPKWETTTASRPTAWTSSTVAWNKFRLYPKPSTTTANDLTFTSDFGVVTAWPSETLSSDFGVVMAVPGETLNQDFGEVSVVHTEGVGGVTVWCTERPATMVGDGDTVPIRRGYQIAPAYYALWHVYEQEGEFHDRILAGYFRAQWLDQVTRGSVRADEPMPRMVNVIGTVPSAPRAGWYPQFESVGWDGLPITFPRGS